MDWITHLPCPHGAGCMICHVDHKWRLIERADDWGIVYRTWKCVTCGDPV